MCQLFYYDSLAITDQRQSVVVNNLVAAYLKSAVTSDYRVDSVTLRMSSLRALWILNERVLLRSQRVVF